MDHFLYALTKLLWLNGFFLSKTPLWKFAERSLKQKWEILRKKKFVLKTLLNTFHLFIDVIGTAL